MNKTVLACCLVTLAVLITGCPHNNYEVTLTPRGGVIERTLVFYRTNEGSSPTNFDPKELASITEFYPKTGVTNEGDRHTVRGEFAGALPGDIGGAGWYRSLSTSLGDAGFYVERFRGSDDLAGMIGERYQTADQLTELVIGWSGALFKAEPGFPELHRFLDRDFRYDLKNLSLYNWIDVLSESSDPSEEYLVRFGQYLIERGYMRAEEAPELIREWIGNDDAVPYRFIQQVIAEKLGITGEQTMPQSLVLIADPEEFKNSWTHYLAGTDSYRAKLQDWEKDKITNDGAQKPDPTGVVGDLIITLSETGAAGGSDRLAVSLSLPSEPVRTNGKWDEIHKQVVWKSGLAEKSQISRLPVFCYAYWVAPREDFQKDHLGGVSLTGENLLNYCLWRTSLDEKAAVEWEQFLTDLKPGTDAIEKLNNFRFAGEPEPINANGLNRDSDTGKKLIGEALQLSR